MIMATTSLNTGDWGAAFDEMAVIEEAETLHPFYQVAFAEVRAILAALRGDTVEADAQMALSAAAAPQLDSQLVTASEVLTRAYCCLYRGEWARSAEGGLVAGKDQNFAEDGPRVASLAAIAGSLGPELAAAITALAESPRQGRLQAAALVAAKAGQVARSGRLEDARAGFREALGAYRDGGDLLDEALAGLTWGLLAGGRDPEAAAAEAAAEAFFNERGAAKMLADYRTAFVPVGAEAGAAATPRAERTSSKVPAG